MTVPQDAVALTCFVDCQKYGFWFAVRAWARDFTSWLIHADTVPAWEDVERLLFETEYPVEGDGNQVMRIWRAGLDTGGTKHEDADTSMTEAAYMWLRANGRGRGCRVWGTKGASSHLAGKISLGAPLEKTPAGKPIPGGLQIVSLDTGRLKDAFHYRLELAKDRQPGAAYLHCEVGEIYVKHITAEEKRRNMRGVEEWVRIRPRNDLLDCEAANMALADPEWPGGGVNLLMTPARMPKTAESSSNGNPAHRARQAQPWVQQPSNWLRR
jgi:phage terminase large subunit GpA-like protein